MTEQDVNYPSVFTVDSYRTTPPPLPPRPGRRRQISPTQVLLLLLVTVALSGMVVEAWLIYRLYHPLPANTEVAVPSAEKMIGYTPTFDSAPTKWPDLVEPPPKPMAHLTDGQDVSHHKHIMQWSKLAKPLLYKVGYKDGSLIFQESGYYYIYSKVSFLDDHNSHHSVQLKTSHYYGNKSIMLLVAIQSPLSKQANSFLAGAFYFYKDDAIFVKVGDTSQLAHREPSENVFGAFKI